MRVVSEDPCDECRFSSCFARRTLGGEAVEAIAAVETDFEIVRGLKGSNSLGVDLETVPVPSESCAGAK